MSCSINSNTFNEQQLVAKSHYENCYKSVTLASINITLISEMWILLKSLGSQLNSLKKIRFKAFDYLHLLLLFTEYLHQKNERAIKYISILKLQCKINKNVRESRKQ